MRVHFRAAGHALMLGLLSAAGAASAESMRAGASAVPSAASAPASTPPKPPGAAGRADERRSSESTGASGVTANPSKGMPVTKRTTGAAIEVTAAPKRLSSAASSRPPQTKDGSSGNTGRKSPKTCRGNASKCPNTASVVDPTRDPRKGADRGSEANSDPELTALHKAERVLFPWALRGISSNFSFDDWLTVGGSGKGDEKLESSTWLRDLRLPATFPNVDGRIVTYLDFYRVTPEGKAILRAWARKRGRYEKSIVATLAKSAVPVELVWQSLVESGHNPTIKSPAGAAGLWQFMPETARLYGLVVDRWLDERLDPERSTNAAARLMADLFQRFGNWELALAAYNMGDAGLLRSIRKYNTNDFWTLSRYEAGLPMETALYVPRIIALTIAMQNPAAFGIDDVTPDEAIDFDTVTLAPGQLLSPVARILGVTEDELAKLNPQLLAQRVPPSFGTERVQPRVNVPHGLANTLRSRMGRLSGLEPDLVAYGMKSGESLEWVANARGVAVDALRTINRMASDERLEAGAVILVPRQSTEPIESKPLEDERVAVVPPDITVPSGYRRIFYRVRGGDSLSSIAEAFGVTRADVLAYNSVDPSARLQQRMLLQIVVPNGLSCESCTFLEESEVNVLVAGSPEFSQYFEGLRGNERIVVQAKDKDSLASIGARYGVSIGMMERINRRSRRDALVTGENIVVYTKRSGNRERVAVTR